MAEQASIPCTARRDPVYWFLTLARFEMPPPDLEILPLFAIG